MMAPGVKINSVLTHDDVCQLFGLNDLPTSDGYEAVFLGNDLSTLEATTSYFTKSSGKKHSWKNDVTQQTFPQIDITFANQSTSSIDTHALTMLETALLTQNTMEFKALAEKIQWSNKTPLELIKAIRKALALEAPLIARKLAEQGVKYHPTHPEINKMAGILASPVATSVIPSTKLDVKANKLWIQKYREKYRGKWVALRNGDLIASRLTFADLATEVGNIKGTDILLTQVT